MAHAPPERKISLVVVEKSIFPDLLRRLLMVIGLILLAAAVLWLDRDGLRDNAHPGEPLSVLDVFYYTMVSLTTVGYGDIVPVSPLARFLNIVFVAPIRVAILVIFIGTAYDIALQRYREASRMKRLREQLNQHIIVCGYGVKGRASIEELLALGVKQEDIVVIDIDPASVDAAAAAGFAALRADATSEAALHAAAVEKAAHIIVDIDKDDTTVLICLTAKHLHEQIHIVAAAKEAENVPLIYRSGADVVVASAVASGRLLAMATQRRYAPRFFEDILSFGEGMDLGERSVTTAEAGFTVAQIADLEDTLPIGAYHEGASYSFDQLHDLALTPGDVVIYISSKR